MKLNSNRERFIKHLLMDEENRDCRVNGILLNAHDEFSTSEMNEAYKELLDLTLNENVSSYIALKKYQKYVPVILQSIEFAYTESVNSYEKLERIKNGGSDRANKKWTKQEDETLIELVCSDHDHSIFEIAIAMGRTVGAIQTRLSNLVGLNRISQKIAGKFIGEINGEETEADIVGTVYRG